LSLSRAYLNLVSRRAMTVNEFLTDNPVADEFAGHYAPVIAVSFFWYLGYSVGWAMQGTVKTANFLPGDASYKYFLDRVFGNYLEQSIPFLASMWLYAASVDVWDAAYCGIFWLIFRLLWVMIWGCAGTSGGPPKSIALVTMPNYIIVNYLMSTPVLWNGVLGFTLKFKELLWGVLFLAVVVQGILVLLIYFPTAIVCNKVFASKFVAGKELLSEDEDEDDDEYGKAY